MEPVMIRYVFKYSSLPVRGQLANSPQPHKTARFYGVPHW